MTRRKADKQTPAEDAEPRSAAKTARTRAPAKRTATAAPSPTPSSRAKAPARGRTAAPQADAVVWEAPDFGRLVVFGLDGQRYALPLDAVQEIQQIVAFSDVPDASSSVVGLVNLRGEVVPAVDLRRVVGMPSRAYDLQTPMIIARTGQGLVAFVVDSVEDVVEVSVTDVQPPSSVYELADRLRGVCRLEDGIVFVFDVETLVPGARAGRKRK